MGRVTVWGHCVGRIRVGASERAAGGGGGVRILNRGGWGGRRAAEKEAVDTPHRLCRRGSNEERLY